MKRLVFILLSFVLLSCSTQKSITTESNTNSNHDTQIEKIYETVKRDSVVIRDSVVLHADGSVSTWHSEKATKAELKNVYWYIRERLTLRKTIVKTIKVTVTKKVHDFIWYTGLLTYILGITFIIYTITKKLKP